MDSGQVAIAKGAALGVIRHALPPIRRPSNHWLQKRLHLLEAGCNEASPGCPRPGNLWGKYQPSSYVDHFLIIGQFLTHFWVLMDLPSLIALRGNGTVHNGARCGACLSCWRCGPLLGRWEPSRGRRHRCGPDRCCVESCNEAWINTCLNTFIFLS